VLVEYLVLAALFRVMQSIEVVVVLVVSLIGSEKIKSIYGNQKRYSSRSLFEEHTCCLFLLPAGWLDEMQLTSHVSKNSSAVHKFQVLTQ
jgi:hypothetical protein